MHFKFVTSLTKFWLHSMYLA